MRPGAAYAEDHAVMPGSFRSVKSALVLGWATLGLALVAVACGGAPGSGESKNSSRDPLENPDSSRPWLRLARQVRFHIGWVMSSKLPESNSAQAGLLRLTGTARV